MAVLKLKPAYKDYIWGGRRLVDEFGIESDKNVAEAWILSAHPDGVSIIDGGNLDGKTFDEFLKLGGNNVLGTNCQNLRGFPIMIKFIDARENLSVQVHPNDDYAAAHENQLGKTEMWYVLDSDETALLYCGFKKKISRDEFIARIKDNSLLEVLNAIPAKRGNVLFIPAGTVHIIGKGVLLAEVQQNSNVSYRIYDYGRNRQLHIAQALDVINFNPPDNRGENYPHVAACDYFVVDKLTLDGKILSQAQGTLDGSTFLSVVILGGNGTIASGDAAFSFGKGDSFFVTADAGDWRICGSCDALLTTIPHAKNF